MKHKLRSSNSIMLLFTVVLIGVFYGGNRNFLSADNVRNILNSMSFVGVLTIGMAMLLIGGEVDLAAGAEACFGGVIAALLANVGLPWFAVFGAVLIFGAASGAVNAFFVNKLKFMSFIATLGVMGLFQGAVRVITQSKNISIVNSFWIIGKVPSIGNVVPFSFVIMVVLMLIYALVLNRTTLGRAIYMVGGNRRAARLCGIEPAHITTLLFINQGMLAALAGAIMASRMHTASPETGASGALDAITAAVLGGISFLGGSGNMAGCFIGILLLNAFNAGLTAVEFPSYWQIVARGALLILALALDFVVNRARRNNEL